MGILTTAWICSLVCSGLLYVGLVRAKIGTVESVGLASLTLFPPVTTALNSGNSVIFAFDFVVPILLLTVLIWRNARKEDIAPYLALTVAAGLIPFLNAFAYSDGPTAISIAAVNFYRLLGITVLGLLISANTQKVMADTFASALAVFACALLLVMVLQGFGFIETNVFEATWRKNVFITGIDYADKKFIVMGMFKAQQGIVWMILMAYGLGYALQRGKHKVSTSNWILITTSSVGLLLTGSKTSIACGIAILLASFALTRNLRALLAICMVGVFAYFFIVFASSNAYASKYINSTVLNFIASGGKNTETLDYRNQRFAQTMEYLSDRPLIVFGIHTSRNPAFNTGYFHNEYMSVFMLGGSVALALYLFYLFRVSRSVFRGWRESPIILSAALVFVGNIIQGLSVAHLQPGFLFVTSVGFSVAAYALAGRAFENRPHLPVTVRAAGRRRERQ